MTQSMMAPGTTLILAVLSTIPTDPFQTHHLMEMNGSRRMVNPGDIPEMVTDSQIMANRGTSLADTDSQRMVNLGIVPKDMGNQTLVSPGISLVNMANQPTASPGTSLVETVSNPLAHGKPQADTANSPPVHGRTQAATIAIRCNPQVRFHHS